MNTNIIVFNFWNKKFYNSNIKALRTCSLLFPCQTAFYINCVPATISINKLCLEVVYHEKKKEEESWASDFKNLYHNTTRSGSSVTLLWLIIARLLGDFLVILISCLLIQPKAPSTLRFASKHDIRKYRKVAAVLFQDIFIKTGIDER